MARKSSGAVAPAVDEPMASAKWPASTSEQRRVATLTAFARNSRTHSDEQIEQIGKSIERFGFTVPVLVDEADVILAGHGRVLAADRLGIETVPVIVARGWSENDKRAYVIADNKIAANAGWDDLVLRTELMELSTAGFDLADLGFSEIERVDFLKGFGGEFGPGSADEQSALDVPKLLSERFGIPPFSVVNAREGWWQNRKRAWIALGIKSEVGRGVSTGADHAKNEAVASFKNQDKFSALQRSKKASPGGNHTDYSRSRAKGTGSGKALKPVAVA